MRVGGVSGELNVFGLLGLSRRDGGMVVTAVFDPLQTFPGIPGTNVALRECFQLFLAAPKKAPRYN